MPTGAEPAHRRGRAKAPPLVPVVLDASAALAVLTDPGGAGDAVAAHLLGCSAHAPSHLPVEVANVLRRWRNAGQLSDGEATLALDGLWDLGVTLWPFRILASRAWELGGAVSAYDGAYVALAERLSVSLLTADARLARAPGLRCDVVLANSRARLARRIA